MRRLLACLVLLLPTPALADGWTAGMQDDEGGPTMVASVAGAADDGSTPMLRLMCGGADGLMLRYDMAADLGAPGSAADFLFENEHDQVSLHMVYEAMDGAFAAYFPATDPVVGLLENGADVFISEAVGNYPAQSFPLKGSRKAIEALLRSCG